MSSETERITRSVLDQYGREQMEARLEQVCGEQGGFGYHPANGTQFASASLIEAAKVAHEPPPDSRADTPATTGVPDSQAAFWANLRRNYRKGR